MTLEERLLHEIQTFFNGEFECTLADLQRPTYVFVRDFYARALMEFEVDTENVRRASHLIENVDRDSVEIIGEVNFVSAINRVFQFLNFGMFDLLSPADNTRRTLTMISSVLEFLGLADELTERLNKDFDQQRALKGNILEAEEEIENIRRSVSELAIEKDQIFKKKIALKNEIDKLKARKQEMSNDVATVEKVMNAGKTVLEEHKASLSAARAELDKLKSDTQNMKEELLSAQSLGTKEEERKRSQQEQQDLHEKYLEKTEAKKKLAGALEAIKKHTAKVEEMGSLFDQVKEREDKLAALRKELDEMKQTVTTLSNERTPIECKARALEEDLSKVTRETEAFREEFKKKVADMRKRETNQMDSICATKDVIKEEEEKLRSLDNKEAEEQERIFFEHIEGVKQLMMKILK